MSEDTEQPGPDPAAGTPEAAPPPPAEETGAVRPRAYCRTDADLLGSRAGAAPPAGAGRGGQPTDAQPTHARPPSRRPPAGSSYPPPPPGSWAPPSVPTPDRRQPVTPTAVPFSYPPSGDATYPGPALRARPRHAGQVAGLAARGASWPPSSVAASAPVSPPWPTTTTATATDPTSPSTRAAPHPGPPSSAATSPSRSS